MTAALKGQSVARFVADTDGRPDCATLRPAAEQGTGLDVVGSFHRHDAECTTGRLHDADNAVVVEAADTGIGMNPDQVPELFSSFRRASTGLDRSHEGCGVGLTLTQGWVDVMGGTVEVETAKGDGTTVTVRLPQAPTVPVDA